MDFGIPQNVDFIAASFVRKGSDIELIRSVLGDAGAHIKVWALTTTTKTRLNIPNQNI